MSGRTEMEALRRLYGENGDTRDVLKADMSKRLPELGECLATQAAELARDFTPERADRFLQTLQGVAAHVRQMRALEIG